LEIQVPGGGCHRDATHPDNPISAVDLPDSDGPHSGY
jgi:hypothetical protein